MLAYVRAMYGETGHSAAPTSVKGKEPVPPLIQDVDDEDMDEYCTDFDDDEISSVVSISVKSEFSPTSDASSTTCDAEIAESLCPTVKGLKVCPVLSLSSLQSS